MADFGVKSLDVLTGIGYSRKFTMWVTYSVYEGKHINPLTNIIFYKIINKIRLTFVDSRHKIEHGPKAFALDVLVRFEIHPQMSVRGPDVGRKLVDAAKVQQHVIESVLTVSHLQVVVPAILRFLDLELVPEIQFDHVIPWG